MKKFVLLFTVFLFGLSSQAQPLMKVSKDSPMLQPWNSLSTATKNLSFGSKAKSSTKVSDVDNSVFVQPEGTKQLCQLDEMIADNPYTGTLYAGYSDTIYVGEDHKTVYLPDLVLMPRLETHYLKGTITEGDIHNGTISIENRQAYAYNVQNLLYIAAIEMQGRDIYLQEKDAFEFKIVNDTIKSNGQMLGAVDAQNNLYVFSRSYTLTPLSEDMLQQNVIPEGLTKNKYELSTPNMWDPETYTRQIVDIARDGNDFYFYGMSGIINQDSLLPVKGTLNDGKIIIPSTQYLGMTSNMYIFFLAGEAYSYEDSITGEEVMSYRKSPVDSITLFYNSETGAITSMDSTGLAYGSGTNLLITFVNHPTFTPFNLEPVVVPDGAQKKSAVVATEAVPGMETYGRAVLVENAYDGQDVYLQFPINDGALPFKGTISGNKLLVDYPQYMGRINNTDYFLHPGNMEVNDWGFGDFYSEEGEGTLEFAYDANDSTISYNDALVATDLSANVMANLLKPTYSIFNDKVPEIPADAVVNQYTMRQTATYNDDLVQIYKGYIANKGNDYYFMYLDPQDSTAVFKGVLKDGKICVVPQYIGGGSNVEYVYPGKFVTEETQWGDTVRNMYVDEDADAIMFDYDPETGEISYDGLIVFKYANGQISIWGHNNLSFTPLTTKPAKPADPVIDEVMYEDWIGTYSLQFHAQCVDTEGNYLDVENLSYRVYNDGELYTFPASLYSSLGKDATEIPFQLSDQQFYYSWEDGSHSALLYDLGKDSVGVQVVYTLDGNKYFSNIVSYNTTSVGIGAVKDSKKPVRVEYYDLQGRKIANPTSGIVLKREIYSDNTVVTKKVLNKQ